MAGRRIGVQHVAKDQADRLPFLPTFESVRSEEFPDWEIVTCPRDDCGFKFLVKTKDWRRVRKVRGAKIVSRPCPYCFKACYFPTKPT